MSFSNASRTRAGLRRPSVIAWLRLAKVFQRVNGASSGHLRSFGLSVAQFDLLAHVGAASGITQRELADRLLVTKGNVTQHLDRMERAGLIARRPEGRTNRIALTNEGRRVYDTVVPRQQDFIARQFSTLSAEEQALLLGLLRTLDHGIARRSPISRRPPTPRSN